MNGNVVVSKLVATLSSRAFWTALLSSVAIATPMVNHVEPITAGHILTALSPMLLWAGGLSLADAATAHGSAIRGNPMLNGAGPRPTPPQMDLLK